MVDQPVIRKRQSDFEPKEGVPDWGSKARTLRETNSKTTSNDVTTTTGTGGSWLLALHRRLGILPIDRPILPTDRPIDRTRAYAVASFWPVSTLTRRST